MAISVSALVGRGDALSIELGRLVIRPASGNPVPGDWLAEHGPGLAAEIVRRIGLDAFVFVEYSVGRYPVKGKSGPLKGGVTLQFQSIVTRKDAYAIFNVDVDRQRDSAGGKAGTPLPKGQFYANKRTAFVKFWCNAGQAMPDRLGRFHKRMGNLAGIFFTGDMKGERFDAKNIRPLEVTAKQVKSAFFPQLSEGTTRAQVGHNLGTTRAQVGHNLGTTRAQVGHNLGTTSGHKETPQTQTGTGLQPFSTTGDFKYGTRYQARGERYTVHGSTPIPSPSEDTGMDGRQLPPEIQSDAEWWEEYDRAIH